jgi:F0F1-type ATP synthase membrane subunit b/b'
MAKNNELFTPEEKIILDKKKKSNEITPEKYQKLLDAKKADISLENIENNSTKTVKERTEEKIKLVENYETNLLEQSKSKIKSKVNKVKDDVEKKVKEKKEKLTKILKEKADKKIPFI